MTSFAGTLPDSSPRHVLAKQTHPDPSSSNHDPFQDVFDAKHDSIASQKPSNNSSIPPLNRNSFHGPPPPPSSPYSGLQSQLYKTASNRAVVNASPITTNMADLSPVSKKTSSGPTYGRSHSLVGFDPLARPPTTISTSFPSPTVRSAISSPRGPPFTSSPRVPRSPARASKGSTHLHLPLAPGSLHESNKPGPPPSSPALRKPTRFSVATPEKYAPLTPAAKSSLSDMGKEHRRDVQSFCVSDLRSVSSEALEQENLEKTIEDIFGVSSSNVDVSETNFDYSASTSSQGKNELEPLTLPRKEVSTPPRLSITTRKKSLVSELEPLTLPRKEVSTPTRLSITTRRKSTVNELEPLTSPRKEASTPTRLSFTPKRKSSTPKKELVGSEAAEMSNEAREDKETIRFPGLASPRKRVLPWAKKVHRRIRSLENKEGGNVAANAAAASNRSSLPNTPTEARRSSMYPAMIQDLMEISFSQLQMPTLAKPSPTSFLTGKQDEVVRTCELDPSPHQMEIPKLREFVIAARLNEFVENYRRVDQNFDLQQWVGMNRMDLRQVKIPQHQPIVQSLLECGDDVSLQGVVIKGASADERIEASIFEGQRQFNVVFRGSTEMQTKPGSLMKAKKNRIAPVPLDAEHGNVDIYSCFKEEYAKLEGECFAMLDKLTEENPFCDVCFTGYSFGAAMATLAAFRYANARPMMRVSCITLASPKVGFSAFKQLVNSSPNLKVMRLEFGQDGKCQLPSLGGYHVGHTLALHGSLGHNSLKTSKSVLAYKFDAPKYKKFKTTHPDLRSYVNALEEVARLGLPWAEDFVGTSGQGVVVNNEARQVV